MKSTSAFGPWRQSVLCIFLMSTTLPALFAGNLTVKTTNYPTLGNPTSAVETYDARYVFVSVTNVGSPNFSGPDSAAGTRKDVVSGIQIFRRSSVPNGGLISAGFVPLGGTGANGLTLLKGGKTLVAGVGDAGVAFLDVEDVIHGTAKPYFASQGDQAGTFDVVATPDGKVVFAANEYGIFQGQRGNVGVVAVDADASGRVTHPRTIGRIATGDVVPSLTLSPDGSRLYVATELMPVKDPPSIAGAGNPTLTKSDCVQKKGSPPRSNGFITVIDAQRAARLESNAILSRVASGCSPVRLTETEDASLLFVSARGDDSILAFVPRLLELDGEHSLLRALPSGGAAPVGIRLFWRDRMLAVANSNRFADSDGTVAILDVSHLSSVVDRVPLKTWATGRFPRNIGISRGNNTLYLTNYSSRSLQVIRGTIR
jgi:hypothetical protein